MGIASEAPQVPLTVPTDRSASFVAARMHARNALIMIRACYGDEAADDYFDGLAAGMNDWVEQQPWATAK